MPMLLLLRFLILPLSTPPLFPYTTLFRSHDALAHEPRQSTVIIGTAAHRLEPRHRTSSVHDQHRRAALHVVDQRAEVRSEEHTSELQSHSDLVCRLLLEKKKVDVTRPLCN